MLATATAARRNVARRDAREDMLDSDRMGARRACPAHRRSPEGRTGGFDGPTEHFRGPVVPATGVQRPTGPRRAAGRSRAGRRADRDGGRGATAHGGAGRAYPGAGAVPRALCHWVPSSVRPPERPVRERLQPRERGRQVGPPDTRCGSGCRGGRRSSRARAARPRPRRRSSAKRSIGTPARSSGNPMDPPRGRTQPNCSGRRAKNRVEQHQVRVHDGAGPGEHGIRAPGGRSAPGSRPAPRRRSWCSP